jgi:hypothetical protein
MTTLEQGTKTKNITPIEIIQTHTQFYVLRKQYEVSRI